MCQITHRKKVLFSDNHFVSRGLAVVDPSFPYYALMYLISEVCVCIYFWLFCHDWRSENEEVISSL